MSSIETSEFRSIKYAMCPFAYDLMQDPAGEGDLFWPACVGCRQDRYVQLLKMYAGMLLCGRAKHDFIQKGKPALIADMVVASVAINSDGKSKQAG